MTKTIVIQGAMPCEVAELLTFLQSQGKVSQEEFGGYLFHSAPFHSHRIVVSPTGIGMANAAAATTLAMLKYAPTYLLNQGLAGAHREHLRCGDLILGKETLSIHSFQKPLAEKVQHFSQWQSCDFFTPTSPFQADPTLLDFFHNAKYNGGDKLQGVIGTGDVWNREAEYIHWLVAQRGSHCEDMESTAVYQIAQKFSTPVLGLRIISNNELTHLPYDEGQAQVLQQFIISNLESLLTL